MSNIELEKYKNLYSQLISEFATLHNSHQLFIRTKGRDPAMVSRRSLRSIAKIANEMKRQGQKVSQEFMANKRLEKIRLREEKATKKTKKHDLAISK
jgi:hypothetical protein